VTSDENKIAQEKMLACVLYGIARRTIAFSALPEKAEAQRISLMESCITDAQEALTTYPKAKAKMGER
jgi:hypothetical protein